MSYNPDPLLAGDAILVEAPLVNRRLVMGHLLISIFFLIYALPMGFLYSLQLTGNYPFPNSEFLSAGKIGLVHSNVLVFGFVFNVLYAGMYWAIPALMKRRIANAGLGMALLIIWTLAVLLTILGIHGGEAQTLPWGETPNALASLIAGEGHFFIADELITVGIILALAQFLAPLTARGFNQAMPVGGWFFGAGLVWFLLAHVIGSYGYELAPGAAGAVFAGVYISGVLGLTLAAFGWGLMYYFVPAVLKQPVWSYAVSMLGFWGLAFFFPMSGVSNYLNSAVPAFAQNSAVVFHVGAQLVILSLAINFFLSLRGKAHAFENIATRYFYTGIGFYAVSAVIGMLEVQFDVQRIAQYTEWQQSHWFLVLYGVFGMWGYGIIYDLWTRLMDKAGWYSHEINEWVYWLNVLGVAGYFVAGVIGGAAQGGLWRGGATWDDVQNTIDGFWQFQSFMIVVLVWSASLMIFNMVMTNMPETLVTEITDATE